MKQKGMSSDFIKIMSIILVSIIAFLFLYFSIYSLIVTLIYGILIYIPLKINATENKKTTFMFGLTLLIIGIYNLAKNLATINAALSSSSLDGVGALVALIIILSFFAVGGLMVILSGVIIKMNPIRAIIYTLISFYATFLAWVFFVNFFNS